MGAPPGERHGRSKMKDVEVRAIRKRYARGGISILALADRYDICYNTCRAIITRKTWKHVADDPVEP